MQVYERLSMCASTDRELRLPEMRLAHI